MSTKTYLIAGAGSGIGKSLAKKLLHDGHKVVAIGRNAEHVGPEMTFLQHDFLDDAPLPDWSETLDGLVYCPGTITLKPLHALKRKDILDDFSVNVLGGLAMVQKYLPNLRSAEDPNIVFFSSVAAQTGMPFHTSVGINKSGVEGLTKSLAAELAPTIRVNCIAPSLTDTPLAGMLLNSDTKRQANAERHPLKRIGTPDDIAALAKFLLTEAHWMTGQIIGINGGMGSVMK